MHFTSFFLAEARIALSLCDWKEGVTVNKSDCGYFNTAQITKLGDLRQVSPGRDKSHDITLLDSAQRCWTIDYTMPKHAHQHQATVFSAGLVSLPLTTLLFEPMLRTIQGHTD